MTKHTPDFSYLRGLKPLVFSVEDCANTANSRRDKDSRITKLEAELAAEREKVELLREALVAFESWWRLPNKQRTIETIESPMRLCIEALAATEPPCKK